MADDGSYCDAEAFAIEAQGHALEFYPSGKDRLRALLALIEGAEQRLQIFYYLFQDDAAGTRVRDAIAAAAARGVETDLIIDRFGSDAPESFFDPVVEAGGRFAVFSPRWNVRYLIRNHQKMAIADRTRAMVGGFNVSDHYFAPPPENGWCDLGVLVEGPVVDDLVRWFGGLADWTHQSDAQFRGIRRMVRDWDPGDGAVRLLVGGPTRIPSTWARQVRRDLISGKRLDLAMAYFSPPLSFRRLIRRLAKRGEARLVMAGKSDNNATIGAARAQYGAMLRAGVKLFEFEGCKMHTKLLVVDDASYFGSANFDHRSIRLNLELMLRFEDPALADRLRKLVDHLESGSREITREVHRQQQGLLSWLRWRVGWFLVSVLDYTVARGLNVEADDPAERPRWRFSRRNRRAGLPRRDR